MFKQPACLEGGYSALYVLRKFSMVKIILFFFHFKIFTVIKHLDLLFEPLEISFLCHIHICIQAHMSKHFKNAC